jgi:hypothetical protein
MRTIIDLSWCYYDNIISFLSFPILFRSVLCVMWLEAIPFVISSHVFITIKWHFVRVKNSLSHSLNAFIHCLYLSLTMLCIFISLSWLLAQQLFVFMTKPISCGDAFLRTKSSCQSHCFIINFLIFDFEYVIVRVLINPRRKAIYVMYLRFDENYINMNEISYWGINKLSFMMRIKGELWCVKCEILFEVGKKKLNRNLKWFFYIQLLLLTQGYIKSRAYVCVLFLHSAGTC